MNLELKFMPMGRVINSSFSLYFRYFFVFTGLFLLGFGSVIATNLLFPSSATNVYEGSTDLIFIQEAIELVYQTLVFGFVAGFAILIVSDVFLNRQVSYRAHFKKSLQNYFKLACISGLKTIFVGLPLSLGSVIMQMGTQLGGRGFDYGSTLGYMIGGTVLFLIGIAWFLVIFPRFSYWVQIAIIEDLSIGKSLKKSFKLSGKNLGQNYGLFFSIYGIAIGIVVVVSIVLSVALLASKMASGGMTEFARLSGTIQLIIMVPFISLNEIGITILYYNARVKSENFGLANLIDQFALSAETKTERVDEQ